MGQEAMLPPLQLSESYYKKLFIDISQGLLEEYDQKESVEVAINTSMLVYRSSEDSSRFVGELHIKTNQELNTFPIEFDVLMVGFLR
jgi:hypothetical protein